MPTPQPGIFALGHRSLHHLQLDLEHGASAEDLRAAIARIGDLSAMVSGVSVVVGFAADVWEQLSPGTTPPLDRFVRRVGADDHEIPAGQHDLWFFLQASAPDAVFDAARVVDRELRGVAKVVEEWPAFTYLKSRDTTGFEDGTENPPLSELPQVALVAEGQPGEGGSVVLLQRWVHDLDGLAQLTVADQEQVIGRTLLDSREIPDDERSPRSHISRVVIEDDDGEELEVFPSQQRLWRGARARARVRGVQRGPSPLSRMLDRMLGIGDGIRDRLTDFSTRSPARGTTRRRSTRSRRQAPLRPRLPAGSRRTRARRR